MLLGRGANALNGVGHEERNGDGLARRGSLAFDPREVEEVLDDAVHPEGLGVDALGEPVGHRRVILELQRLGQQPERTHRGLQFVRDVGDEVATDVLEATTLGYVLDYRQHAKRSAAVVDDRRADGQCPARGPVDVDDSFGDAVRPSLGEDLGHGLGGDGVTVATGHEDLGLGVSKDHAAAFVAEHESEGQGIERSLQAHRLGAGLADRRRRGAGRS